MTPDTPRPLHTRPRLAGDLAALEGAAGRHPARAHLDALERLGAKVLLLGAGFGSCTAFHLAEYRVPGSPVTTHGAAVRTPEGGRTWVTFRDLDLDEDDFPAIGAHLVATGRVRVGDVGAAGSHLFDLAEGVVAVYNPGAAAAASPLRRARYTVERETPNISPRSAAPYRPAR